MTENEQAATELHWVHPALSVKEPRQRWKAYQAHVRATAKYFSEEVLTKAEEALRQILIKRTAIKGAPSEAAQQELIDAFNPFTKDGINRWSHGVKWTSMNADEAVADAVKAMDAIAETLRRQGRKVSFIRQGARRHRLEALGYQIERSVDEYFHWAKSEEAAVKAACPDYERLAPKFTRVSPAGDELESAQPE